jgi:GNAT superfamily N-acetyltransferase
MASIRKAGKDDGPALLALLERLHGESAYADLAVKPEKLRQFLHGVLTQPTHTCFVHIRPSGDIDGFIMGYLTTPFFSDETIAYDVALYLVPEARGSLAAARLFRALSAWAKQKGARQLWIGTSAGIDPARSRRFYLGMGLEEIGGVFRTRL